MHQDGHSVAELAQTVVILQDDCYGHRFSRPRTSRANLGTIVERPERIHAAILGLATAYVRLGGRHAEGSAAPHPKRHQSSLPPAPFRIQKTARRLSLASPAASAIHGAQWMSELADMCDDAESKLALSGKELTRPSTSGQPNGRSHVEKAKLHEGDLYLCSGSLKALEGALGGVCEGVDAVFNDQGPRRAFVCIRPPGHHCSSDAPSGFCWLNNVHVGIGHAVLSHGLTHAAIIDFDLHHGDGSQSITWAHNSKVASMPKNTPLTKKTAIGYFSLHDINSYPCEEGDDEKVRNASLCIENAHGQNIWNVHLQSWKTEAEFWRLYEEKYSIILTKARDFLRLHSEKLRQAPTHPKPKAAIFLSAGFDASDWESPGMQRHQVNVPTSFYARLTSDVVTIAAEEGLGVDGRVISVLEGGYSDRALMSGVLSHISGLTAVPSSTVQTNLDNGQGSELGLRPGKSDLNGNFPHRVPNVTTPFPPVFEPDWWSLQRLEEIENLVNPPVVTAPKKQRKEVRPTYTSATQSFTAKIVSPPHGRRSFSGGGGNLQESPASRPPSPPPPAVDWSTAAHELSKLLIPSDRETRSCRPEDLNAEASRARRDRYSSIGLPAPVTSEAATHVTDPNRMQLRDRRSKPPQYASENDDEKPPSRANRRKTIADVSLLGEDAEPPTRESNSMGVGVPAKHSRRRSSIASNASSMNAEKGSDFSLGSVNDAEPKRQFLVVKKPRAPANPRTEQAKAKTVKKQPPVPRFPSASSTAPITENYQASTANSQGNAKVPLSTKEEPENRNLDQLASDLQTLSIKLKVPPKEEYEARQNKPKAAPRGRPSKSTAKAASPTKAKVKIVQEPPAAGSLPKKSLSVQQLPPLAISAGQVQEHAVASPPATTLHLQPAASDVPVNVSNPTISPINFVLPQDTDVDPSQAATADSHSKGEGHVEVLRPEKQAEGTPEKLPECTNPTTPITVRRTKQDLPVFTSTSPISFGNSNVISSSMDQVQNKDHEIVFTPSPQATTSSPGDPAITAAPQSEDTVPGETQQIDPSSMKNVSGIEAEPHSSASIWDVPDTPQPRKP